MLIYEKGIMGSVKGGVKTGSLSGAVMGLAGAIMGIPLILAFSYQEIVILPSEAFEEGMKVAVEIVAVAAHVGLIPVDREVISISGTGQGADTAILVQTANSTRIFDMTIEEIIAKPRAR